MAFDAFELDMQNGAGIVQSGKPNQRVLVAVLKFTDTSWTCPRTSKYTFYAYGAGGPTGGSFCRLTKSVSAGTVLACSMSIGLFTINSSGYGPFGDTTLTGPDINLVAGQSGGPATGGDFNMIGTSTLSGGDGSFYGRRNGMTTTTMGGLLGYIGRNPGGPTTNANNYAIAGSGEIYIVDETP